MLLALAACGAEVAVLEGSDAGSDAQDFTEEEEKRTARKAIRIETTVNGATAEQDIPANQLATLLGFDCLGQLRIEPGGAPFMNGQVPSAACKVTGTPPPGSEATCDAAICEAEADLCVANRLLEIASAVGPTSFSWPNPDGPASVFRLGPQDQESATALREEAFRYGALVVAYAGENLRKAAGKSAVGGTCTAAQMTSLTIGGIPYGEAFATMLTEGTLIAEEAARAAVKSHVAVATADFARVPDAELAARFSWVNGEMSRARAAHLLIGGGLDKGMADFKVGTGPAVGSTPASATNTQGICPTPPPTGSAGEAKQILRLTGAYPLAISSSASFTTLFEAGTLGDASLRDRLAERTGDPAIATMTAARFLETRGLNEIDFAVARTSVTEENKAFARSGNATLPPVKIAATRNPDGTITQKTTTRPIYAATGQSPGAPPKGYYRGNVRFAFPSYIENFASAPSLSMVRDAVPPTATTAAVPNPTSAGLSLTGLLDYGRSVASELVALPTATSPLSQPVMRQLGMYMGAAGKKVSSRFETCYRRNTPAGQTTINDEYRIRLYGTLAGVQAAGDYRLVVGTAGVRCATEGDNEGSACNLAAFTINAAGGTGGGGTLLSSRGGTTGVVGNADYSPQAGFTHFVEFNIIPPLAAGSAAPDIYVVKLVPGKPAVPGNYVLAGNFRAVRDSSAPSTVGNYRFCSLQPQVEDIDQLVQDILTPAPESCGTTEKTCVLTGLSDKLPLESELTEDGDAFESSWRTHLNRARSAADRADFLGEQLIESGLEIDRRVETSVEAIETLCGEGISLAAYFPGDMSGYRGEACANEGGPCASPAGTVCTNGMCVADPIEILKVKAPTDANARKILECLGDAQLVDISVGSRPMCMWIKRSNNGACSPIGNAECPFPATETAGAGGIVSYACTAPTGFNATEYAMRGPTKALGYSDLPVDDPPPPDDLPICSALALLRVESPDDPEGQLGKIATFLTKERVEDIARRVGWQARPNDFSTVTVDGVPTFTTGSLFSASATTSWPCGTVPLASREASQTTCAGALGELTSSLFCASSNSCAKDVTDSVRGKRAQMNQRLGRAVLALRVITGVGLDGFQGPYIANVDWSKDETEDNYGNDYSMKVDFGAAGGNAGNLPPPDNRSIMSGSMVRFVTVEHTGPNSWNTNEVQGYGLCFASGAHEGWTDIFGPLSGTKKLHYAACKDHASKNPAQTRDWWPIAKAYPGSMGSDPQRQVSLLWQGLNSTGVRSEEHAASDMRQLIHDLLMHPVLPDTVVIAPHGPDTKKLSTYWNDESRVIGFELDSHGESDYTRPIYQATNDIAIARDGLRARDILDGLELACEVARMDAANAVDCAQQAMPSVSSLADVGIVERQLQCAANVIKMQAERMVFLDVPGAVLKATQSGAQLKGELGTAAGDFAGALKDLYQAKIGIRGTLDDFASNMRLLRLALAKHQVAAEKISLNLMATVANWYTACAAEAVTWGVSDVTKGKSIAVCSNSLLQIALAFRAAELDQTSIELDGSITFEQFKSLFSGHAESMARFAADLEASQARLAGALARLKTARLSGLRELAKAMMLSTDAMGRHFAVNTVMRRRYNTLLVRYERARDLALKAAWIGERAIGQRIGMDLSTIHQDLLLVENPASWAGNLCALPAIDYSRIRDDSDQDPATNDDLDLDRYADEYIGDYVTKLESVMASYDFDFPFHEGSDTAVISLRDDVSHARDNCEISVPNLLAYSARLDVVIDPETSGQTSFVIEDEEAVPEVTLGLSVWEPRNCPTVAGQVVDCARAHTLGSTNPADQPIDNPRAAGGDVSGYRVTFGGPGIGGVASFQPWSTSSPTMIAQEVNLQPAYYRLSWYGRQIEGSTFDPVGAVSLRKASNIKAPNIDGVLKSGNSVQFVPSGTWKWYWTLFRVDEAGTYVVALLPSATTATSHSVDLGAIMLENVGSLIPGNPPVQGLSVENFAPAQFLATTSAGTGYAPVCEDTDGSVFQTHWQRGRQQLCPTGFGTCTNAPFHEYWELPFDISLAALEDGHLLSQAGFAYGNYNYRVENIAVNVVGTGIRDCSDSSLPSTCQASASVPFSIEHRGPSFQVRNHIGEVYNATLFDARIEHGRGLAAERYITNPISSADRSLIEPYSHRELRGRPLTGHYVLRIWDADGVKFDRIEDVQLVLDYRYWTRFE